MLEHMGAVAGAARGVSPAMAASRFALRKLRLLGTFDVRWVELGGTKGLTADDVVDLEAFLDQRDSRALLSALAMTLLMPRSEARDESLSTMRAFFDNLVQQRHAALPNKWQTRRDEIWGALLAIYDKATPAGKELADAALEFEDFIRTPVGRSQIPEKTGSGYSRYIERLASLCADVHRVTDAIHTAERIRDSIAAAPTPPIITYMSTTKSATFDDLYVTRTLIHEASGAKVDGARLGGAGAPYRAVVHGAPGAGKSTFVRALRKELAKTSAGQPAILLNARSYFPGAQHQAIVEHLAEGFRTSSNLEISDGQLRDALTLGHALVIFDGIDEITDIGQRIEMVQRISTFATEYPAASVLVTSRSVGYERAPLPPSIFETLTLEEYTTAQTQEYVRRWFGFMGRPDLEADFLRESEAVSDLKRNPLLLSLLCVLYRERGTIPRRRREVYQQCADLLFHTWDSHRRIDQPEELHANGDRIMQELARWVFKSPKAQNGLSERVIRNGIGGYLRDAVGVEENEARRRAGEFLEFCATRAWLLGVVGTDHGERVFGFTHRTFFEYFTAEATSRTTSDVSEIAKTLVEAHKRDATSVLPELLLQAIDEKVDRGAANTFKEVCELTDDETLILRLMEGVPLPSLTRARGFDRVLELWRGRRSIPEEAFAALLALHVDARDQFIRDYLTGNTAGAADLFLGGWATLSLSRGTSRHDPIWRDQVDLVVAEAGSLEGWWFGSAAAAWLWRTGRGPLPAPRDALVCVGSDGHCVGSLWLGLELAHEAADENTRAELSAVFAAVLKRARKQASTLARATATAFADLAIERAKVQNFPSMRRLEGDGVWAYLYAVAVVYEVVSSDSDTLEWLLHRISPMARDLLAERAASGGEDSEANEAAPDSPRLKRLPKWLKDWRDGKRAFTDWG